jgi:DNA-binding response OmpR family regulator
VLSAQDGADMVTKPSNPAKLAAFASNARERRRQFDTNPA